MKSIPPKTDAVDRAWKDGAEGEGGLDLSGLVIESPHPEKPAAPRKPPGPPRLPFGARTPTPVTAAPADDEFEVVDLDEIMDARGAEPAGSDYHVRPTPVPQGDDEPEITARPAGGKPGPTPPGGFDLSTMRPPQAESDYVADAMGRAPRSPRPPGRRADAGAGNAPQGESPGFFREDSLDFSFGDLDTPSGGQPHGSTPSAVDQEIPFEEDPFDRPTRPVDVPPTPPRGSLGSDLDFELDQALGGARLPAGAAAPRDASPPTRRGLGESSEPPRFRSAREASLGLTPPSSPLAAASVDEPPPSSGAVPARAAASPPRLRADAPVRLPSASTPRTPPSLDAPFATASSAKLARAGGARERQSPMPVAPKPRDPIAQIRDRFDLGDYTGALVQAEAVLEERPDDPDANRFADACRTQLRQMYLSRIGDRSQIPRVVMESDQLRWLSLDHRAGFLLSVIDGASSIDDVLDVSGMPELDTLRILYDFLLQGVIQMEPVRRGRR
jgi:hypothetical protein